MWRRPFVTILIIVIPMILTQSMRAQQKPLTRDQVQGLVRDGLEDESGAVEMALPRHGRTLAHVSADQKSKNKVFAALCRTS
ncbi:MAG TPA: hypothetical protein VMX16_04175 [Terriglobia bacterium]|nr:hypothetical protein [Terriglobia bacterium]